MVAQLLSLVGPPTTTNKPGFGARIFRFRLHRGLHRQHGEENGQAR